MVKSSNRILTKRLVLRENKLNDIDDIITNINNLNISRYMAAIPFPYTRKKCYEWLNRNLKRQKEKPRRSYMFAICFRKENRVIGGIGFSEVDYYKGCANIGYWLGEKYWHQGIMSEAMYHVNEFAFNNLKLRRINLPVYVPNKASNALARKLGYVLEGMNRKAARPISTGKIMDVYYYGLLKEDWKKWKKKNPKQRV